MAHSDAVHTDYGTGKKQFNVYLTGILLCVLFTLVPFYLVMNPVLSRGLTFLTIYVCAIVQLFIQVICFLRLNTKTEQSKTNVMAFIFTLVILGVVIGGSLWIMWNLDYNMM